MSSLFGMRETDIARREAGITSWLGFRDYMPGSDLADLFSEGVTGVYLNPTRSLTSLALRNLVDRGTVQESMTMYEEGATFWVFNLAKPSAASSIDPGTVELAPREMVLMGRMEIGHEAWASTQLDEHLHLDPQVPDPWRTEACLGHLAKLGLVEAVQNPPGTYRLP